MEEKVEFTDRTARNFIRVATEFPNRKAIAELGQTKVFAILSLPQEDRDDFKFISVEQFGKIIVFHQWDKLRA